MISKLVYQDLKQNPKLELFREFLSIIPPLVAILLALIFRQVIVSLLLGVYIGAVFIFDNNPLTGFIKIN